MSRIETDVVISLAGRRKFPHIPSEPVQNAGVLKELESLFDAVSKEVNRLPSAITSGLAHLS